MGATTTPGPRRNKALFPAVILLLLLTAANFAVYLARHEIDMFLPATYKTLYHPTDVPTLVDTRILGHGRLMLKIAMREQPRRWIVTDDAGGRAEQTGESPVLELKEFIHAYEIEVPDRTPPLLISIRFGFYTSEYYKKGGRTQPDNYWLISASIPMGKFRQYSLSRWIDAFRYVAAEEKDEARRILREEMNVAGGESALEKIEKICAYQGKLYKTQAGTPDDRMQNEVSPLRMFRRVQAKEGFIWCTQMAIIYHFFANLAGVPTRLITLNGHLGPTITTGHSFAESFIPERNGWARVDPSGNKFYVWNRENKLLNSADILHAVLNGSYSDLSVRALKDGEIITAPYGEHNASDIQMFSPGAQLIYRRGNYKADGAVARYLFAPNLAYSLDADYATRLYLRRWLLFLAWIAALVVCLSVLALRDRRRVTRGGRRPE